MAKLHGNTKVKTIRNMGVPVKGKHGDTTIGKIRKETERKSKKSNT